MSQTCTNTQTDTHQTVDKHPDNHAPKFFDDFGLSCDVLPSPIAAVGVQTSQL